MPLSGNLCVLCKVFEMMVKKVLRMYLTLYCGGGGMRERVLDYSSPFVVTLVF